MRRHLLLAGAACVALAFFASFGSAAVNVAQSGWSWGNPTPQGNTLQAIDFVQGRGYAAGAAGTVLRTDDAGATWTGLATGTSADLTRLQVLDPDTLIVLGGAGCVLRRSDDGGKTFHKIFIVAEQNCPAPVGAFTFVDKQVGYLLLTDGSVLRTADGGQTFARQTAVPGTVASNNSTGATAVDIAFTGADTGIVFVSPSGSAPSIAYSTSDGGVSWKPVAAVDPGHVRRMYFLDSKNGYAVGADTLLATADGGTTWKAQPAGPGHDLTSIRCTGVNTCLMTVSKGDVLLRTTDGGQTFARQTAVPGTVASNNSTGATAVDIAFTGSDTGIVFVSPSGGGPSIAYSTSDGGVSWKPVDAVDPGHVRRMYFLDSKNGYAVGADTLLATADGGTTWKAQPAGPGHDLTSIRCTDVNTCLMTVSKGDVLLRTTDGGQTATPITASSQAIHAAAFASSSRVVAVGDSGATVVSDDGGVNYTPVSHDIGGSYQSLRPGPTPSSAFALGLRGALAVTNDGGTSWKTLAVPTSADVLDASFPTATTGYALDINGGLFKTTNSGTTWQTLDTGTTARPRALAAPAADTIVVVGPKGIRRAVGAAQPAPVGGKAVTRAALSTVVTHPNLLVAYGARTRNLFLSTDKGKTWKKIKLPGKKALIGPEEGVDFVTSKVGVLIDRDGRVWKTSNAGKSWAQLLGSATDAAFSVSLSNAANGFLGLTSFGRSGANEAYVLRTSDGGKTWRPQAIARGGLFSVIATSPQQAYSLVDSLHLFFTASGGDAGTPSTLKLRAPVKVLTKKQLRKVRGRVVVSGSLAGAVGGEQIVVSERDINGHTWAQQVVTAGANGGSFTASFRIQHTSAFVAQWAGDSGRRGAGSTPLIITVKEPHRKKK